MKQVLWSLLVLGLSDLVNPTGITLVILLLTLAKKRSHIMAFILTAYLCYAGCAIAILYGVDKYFMRFVEKLLRQYPAQLVIAEMVLGIAMLILFALSSLYLIKTLRQKRTWNMAAVLPIKSANLWFILFLAVTTTVSEMPSSVSILAYIGILAINKIRFPVSAILLMFFSAFTMIIPTAIYMLSAKLQVHRFEAVMEKTKKICSAFYAATIPIFFLVIGLLTLYDAFTHL